MKRDEAKRLIQETVGDTPIRTVSCSLTGFCSLLDELGSEFDVRCDIERMYHDKSYYIERGGWVKFTRDNNGRFIDVALDKIEDEGYEVVGVDFFNDINGSLFLNVENAEHRCNGRDKGQELHDFLNGMSPDAGIKLYDSDGNKLFDGYAGEVTESVMFQGWKVDAHSYRDGEMMIWIY